MDLQPNELKKSSEQTSSKEAKSVAVAKKRGKIELPKQDKVVKKNINETEAFKIGKERLLHQVSKLRIDFA